MPPPRRRTRGRPRDESHAARRRDEILATATRLFAAHGYRNLDVQRVADELGIGKGTVYRHFPTKQALFLAAVDRGMRRLTDRADTIRTEHPDPLDRMRAAIRAHLEFFAGNPDLVELFIQERAEFRDRQTPTYFVYRGRRMRMWKDLLHRLIAAGRIRRVPVERITLVVGDVLYGMMFTNYFAPRRRSPRRQADDIIDIVFHGILTGQAAPASRSRGASGSAGAGGQHQ